MRAGRTDKMTTVPLNPFPAAAQARPEHGYSASAHLSLSSNLFECLCATVCSTPKVESDTQGWFLPTRLWGGTCTSSMSTWFVRQSLEFLEKEWGGRARRSLLGGRPLQMVKGTHRYPDWQFVTSFSARSQWITMDQHPLKFKLDKESRQFRFIWRTEASHLRKRCVCKCDPIAK